MTIALTLMSTGFVVLMSIPVVGPMLMAAF